MSSFLNSLKIFNSSLFAVKLNWSFFRELIFFIRLKVKGILKISPLISNKFDNLAITIGCNPGNRKKLNKCVKRILKSEFAIDVDLSKLKEKYIIMEKLTKKIQIAINLDLCLLNSMSIAIR